MSINVPTEGYAKMKECCVALIKEAEAGAALKQSDPT